MNRFTIFLFCSCLLVFTNCVTLSNHDNEQPFIKINTLQINYYAQLNIKGKIAFLCSTNDNRSIQNNAIHELIFDDLSRVLNDNWNYENKSYSVTTYTFTNSSFVSNTYDGKRTIKKVYKEINNTFSGYLYENDNLYGQQSISNIFSKELINTIKIIDSDITSIIEYHFLPNALLDYWIEKHKGNFVDIIIRHQCKYTNNLLTEVLVYDDKKTYEKINFIYDENMYISHIDYYDERMQLYKKEVRIK
jgi:hypothetical protein